MNVVVVLGFRRGLDEAIARRGLRPYHVVEKLKPQLADREHVRVARLEDAQEVLRALHARDVREVCAVVTAHEEAVFTAAVLRAHFRTAGDRDYARTLFFRDKFLQKRALPPVLPRARCMYATGYLAFADLAGLLGEPFVVKPANGYGSARTSVISSAEELAGYWAQGADRSDVQFVAESFVPGEEVHVDGVWQHGELVWSCLSRYAEAPADWSQGGVVASGQVARASQPKLYQQIEELARTALAALEAPATVFHLEAFMRADGEPVFGECAIRVAGAMVPEVIDLTYGVDLYDAALSLALGEKPDLGDARSPHRYFGYILLRRFPGVDLTEDDFRAAFDLHDISFGSDARVGSYGRIGHAVVGHADSDELHRLMVDVIAFNRTGLPPRRPRRRAGGSDDA